MAEKIMALCSSCCGIRSLPTRGDLHAEDAVLAQQRFVIERLTSWLKSFHRLRYQVDRTATLFQALVYLAVRVLCVRRLVSLSEMGITFDEGASVTLRFESGSRNRVLRNAMWDSCIRP
jgi:hypothetical protein